MRPRRRRLQRLRKKWTYAVEGIGIEFGKSGLDAYVQLRTVRRTWVTFRVWGRSRGSWDNVSKNKETR